MRIQVNEERDIVLTEVFNGLLFETSEGNRLGLCMRDDTFEINILPRNASQHQWFRVNMQTLTIEPMT